MRGVQKNLDIKPYIDVKPIRQDSRAFKYFLFLPIGYEDGALYRKSIDEYMSKARYSNVGTKFIEAYKKDQKNILLLEKNPSEEKISDESITVVVPRKIRFFAWYIDFAHKIWPGSITKKILYFIFLPVGVTWFFIGFMPIFIGSYCYKIYHHFSRKKEQEYIQQVWQYSEERIKNSKIINKDNLKKLSEFNNDAAEKLENAEKENDKLKEKPLEFQEPEINSRIELPPVESVENRIEEVEHRENIEEHHEHQEEHREHEVEIEPEPLQEARIFKKKNILSKSFSTEPTVDKNILENSKTTNRYSFSSSGSENENLHKRFLESRLRKDSPIQEEAPIQEIVVIEHQEHQEPPSLLKNQESIEERASRVSSRSRLSNRSKESFFSTASRLTKDSTKMGYEFDDELEIDPGIILSIKQEEDSLALEYKNEEYVENKKLAKKELVRLIKIEKAIYSELIRLDQEIEIKERDTYKPFQEADLGKESAYYMKLNEFTDRHLKTDPNLSEEDIGKEISRFENLQKNHRRQNFARIQNRAISLSLQAEDIGHCYQERANLIAVWDYVHEKAGKAEAEYKTNDLYSLHVKQRTADIEYEKYRKVINLLEQENEALKLDHDFKYEDRIYHEKLEIVKIAEEMNGGADLALSRSLTTKLNNTLSQFDNETNSKELEKTREISERETLFITIEKSSKSKIQESEGKIRLMRNNRDRLEGLKFRLEDELARFKQEYEPKLDPKSKDFETIQQEYNKKLKQKESNYRESLSAIDDFALKIKEEENLITMHNQGLKEHSGRTDKLKEELAIYRDSRVRERANLIEHIKAENKQAKIAAINKIYENYAGIKKIEASFDLKELAFKRAVIEKLAIQYSSKKLFFIEKREEPFPDYGSLLEIAREAETASEDIETRKAFIETNVQKTITLIQEKSYSTLYPGYHIVKRMEDKVKQLNELRNTEWRLYSSNLDKQSESFTMLDLTNDKVEETLMDLGATKTNKAIKNSTGLFEQYKHAGEALYNELKSIINDIDVNVARLRYVILYQQYMLFLQDHISRVDSNKISEDRQENRELALWFFDATSAKMIKDIRHMLYKKKCAELLRYVIDAGETSHEIYKIIPDIIKGIKNINVVEKTLYSEINFSNVASKEDLQDRIDAFEGSYLGFYRQLDQLSELVRKKVIGK